MRYGAISLAALIGFMLACANSGDEEKGNPLSASDRATIAQSVDGFRDAGLLMRLDVSAARAYVDIGLWRMLDAEEKENATRIIAAHIADSDQLYLDIYDAQSGEKLANVSAMGFRVVQ